MLLICAVTLSAQIQSSVILSPEEYCIENEEGYSRIKFDYQFYSDEVGTPEIPVIHKSYAIPIDATNVSLQINACTTTTLMEN